MCIQVCRCRNRILVGFTTTYAISAITTNIMRSNPAQAMCSRYNIKLFTNLLQVSGFQRVLRFPPPIKLKYC